MTIDVNSAIVFNMREKIKRNQEMYKYYKKHLPDTDYAILGRKFGMSRQGARQIIIRMEKRRD